MKIKKGRRPLWKLVVSVCLVVLIGFMLSGCGPHLKKGRCHVWSGGDKICGPVNECFTGKDGVKIVHPIYYKGHLVNGAPKGEGEACIGKYDKDKCSLKCFLWVQSGEENNCPKIAGNFNDGKVTGYATFPNTPKEKIVDKPFLSEVRRFWDEEISRPSKCKKSL